MGAFFLVGFNVTLVIIYVRKWDVWPLVKNFTPCYNRENSGLTSII